MEGVTAEESNCLHFGISNIFLKNLKKSVSIWLLLSLYIVEGKGRDENNDADNGLDALKDCPSDSRCGLHQTACGTAAISRSFSAINISAESAANRSRLLSEKNRQN